MDTEILVITKLAMNDSYHLLHQRAHKPVTEMVK